MKKDFFKAETSDIKQKPKGSGRLLKKHKMSNEILNYLLGILSLLLIPLTGLKAQQQVLQGSTRNYQVTHNNSGAPNNYTYLWTVDGSGNTIATSTGFSTDITWNASPGLYTITMTESNGSCSTINTIQVQVLGAPDLSFASAASNGGCANIAATVPLSFSGSSNSIYFPLVVNYTIDGVAQPALTFNQGDPLEITLNSTQRADRPATGNYSLSLVITGATAHGGNVHLIVSTSNTHTVNDIPEINPIIAN